MCMLATLNGLGRVHQKMSIILTQVVRPLTGTSKAICPNNSTCPVGYSCCYIASGTYGCCPFYDVRYFHSTKLKIMRVLIIIDVGQIVKSLWWPFQNSANCFSLT